MITSETTPLYVEAKIAEATGFSRDTLKRVRLDLLEKKIEWSIIEKQVVLTLPAMVKVVNYLTEATGNGAAQWPGAIESCRLAGTPLEKKEGLVTLTVLRCMANHRLLSALEPPPMELTVTVRVKDNANFRPKMTLRARLVHPGLYQMEGRSPRFPGRY